MQNQPFALRAFRRLRLAIGLTALAAVAAAAPGCAWSARSAAPVPLVAPPKSAPAPAPQAQERPASWPDPAPADAPPRQAAAPPAGPQPPRADAAAAPPVRPAPSHRPAAGPVEVRVRITDDQGTRIVRLPLDEYVLGCVRAELAPKTLLNDAVGRVLQVQAIVSRTYAIANFNRHDAEGFDLCDSTHCQLYRPALSHEHAEDFAARAVADTRGQVITFEGRAIQAVFHANCGGHTAAAEHVWKGPGVPYLRPVPDWFCSRSAQPWEFVATEAQLRQAFNADDRSAIGNRLDRIDISERDAAGRATLVTIAGARSPVVRAEEFRSIVRQAFGPRSLQSTWFSVTRSGPQFRFTGLGYGHGVGLCQYGAAQRAQAGLTPSVILAHYFPGTRIDPAVSLAAVQRRLAPTVAAH